MTYDGYYGPGGWARENDLPRRTPGRIEDAETVRQNTDADPGYEAAAEHFRQEWEGNQGQPHMVTPNDDQHPAFASHGEPEPVWTTLEGRSVPPWNKFDTFLRRALMIGGNLLVWAIIALGVLTVAGVGYGLSQLGNDAPATAPYEEQILPDDPAGEVEPGIDPCEVDPESCGTGN